MKATVRKINQSIFPVTKEGQQVFRDLPKTEFVINIETEESRTSAQNNAIHLYCRNVADAANAAGYEMHVKSELLRDVVEIPWTWQSVKENIWLPVQMAQFPSILRTRDLKKTEQVSAVAQVIERYLSEKKGLNVPFPSKDTIGFK
jgi:hypothetical protein|tara:strand:+ start:442 stop:879 length:438 start_codon:yes stop_codon:yes gene_type:complete